MENSHQPSEKRNLILSLIKQDLICNKLVLGLSDLGLDAGRYHLDIGTIVLHMMGFTEGDEEAMELYYGFMERALTVRDVEEEGELLESLAGELYQALGARR